MKIIYKNTFGKDLSINQIYYKNNNFEVPTNTDSLEKGLDISMASSYIKLGRVTDSLS